MKLLNRIKQFFQPTKRCMLCGRRLSTKLDRARGMGAGCARKIEKMEPRLPAVNKDGGEDM